MKNGILFTLFVLLTFNTIDAQIFRTTKGNVYFKSDAPLELIEANSKNLRGAINIQKKTFAFSISIKSFKGFNSALQRVHFNENYMESDAYANATFSGKIIEKIDFSTDGIHIIRAKGKLKIHNVEQERIIKSTIEIKKGKLMVTTNFTVLLEEHEIRVPKVVHQKIAQEIFVNIEAAFKQ